MDDFVRLDSLVAKKAGVSRVAAVDLIEKGGVSLSGKVLLKPGAKYPIDSEIAVITPENIYVGRGGYKLETALLEFGIDLTGKVCADIGASTGGFTHCMLINGACLVYAVDSGTGQLADKLRSDFRVVSMEQTDARTAVLPEPVDFLSVDVSFISATKVTAAAYNMLKQGGEAVFLIKPQFEAGPGVVNKKGVIKNEKIHLKILKNMYNYYIEHGFSVEGTVPSPILGQNGNKEYLVYLKKTRKEVSL